MMKKISMKHFLSGMLICMAVLALHCSRDKSTITGADNPAPPDTLKDWKPAIYIYPDSPIDLTVTLSFPQGGRVTTSEPLYPETGWQVNVQPDGVIDNAWPYLFYECNLPYLFQTDTGWRVEQSDLTGFFQSCLQQYGLNERELADFIAFWPSRLTAYDIYLIYPQPRDLMDEIIKLDLSVQPQNMQRLHFLFRGVSKNDKTIPTPPQIKSVKREGLTVIEWGGMMYNE